jgi:glycosyltransferase involved in cell wall biosynthesis
MKILHITPHLGGGVGKAHAAMAAVRTPGAEQSFVLLEDPRDRRYVTQIEATGSPVIVARDFDHIAGLAADADVVQFEFWNHPRLFECLARCEWPAIRSVFWSHVSGLNRPVIQPGLMGEAGRFVFSSEASLIIPSLFERNGAALHNVAVINSGFGFAKAMPGRASAGRPRIAYLGTVDFIKMHPGFFEAVDRLSGDGIEVDVWGACEPDGEVARRAAAMRHPERIRFRGYTDDPLTALSAADIFFYPLQPDHYGTAENALIEAMSIGRVPVVLDNPAERAIVNHCATGFVARSIDECVEWLYVLLHSPRLRHVIGGSACRAVNESRAPERSAQAFSELWHELRNEPKRAPDFRAVVGDTPADWFLATQCLPGEAWRPAGYSQRQAATKGTLAHFRREFPDDPSLSLLVSGGAGKTDAAA